MFSNVSVIQCFGIPVSILQSKYHSDLYKVACFLTNYLRDPENGTYIKAQPNDTGHLATANASISQLFAPFGKKAISISVTA